MPHSCEGRPESACLDKRCDETVVFGQGDMWLCKACRDHRFPPLSEEKRKEAIAAAMAKPVLVAGQTAQSKGPTVIYASARSSASPSAPPLPPPSSSTAAAGSSSVVTRSSTSSVSPVKLVVSELLTYVMHYRNKSTVDALRRCVLHHYTANDITAAKKLFIKLFETKLSSNTLATERRSSSSRPAHEAEIDDIIGLANGLDEKDDLQSIKFVAADLERLPKYGPEEINMAYIAERHSTLDADIGRLTTELSELKESIGTSSLAPVDQSFTNLIIDLSRKFESFQTSVNARIDSLNSICASATSAPQPQAQEEIDRSLNIIIFGVAENRDPSVWRTDVDTILKFVVGRDVDIVDLFRLGRFRDDKRRPVLVKLRTVWDRRLILQASRKLKSYTERIFISPDDPVDVRRKKTLDRMKYRAGREGKNVQVDGGVLIVDGVPKYSLSSGFINNDNDE